jgi:hypothetical protein
MRGIQQNVRQNHETKLSDSLPIHKTALSSGFTFLPNNLCTPMFTVTNVGRIIDRLHIGRGRATHSANSSQTHAVHQNVRGVVRPYLTSSSHRPSQCRLLRAELIEPGRRGVATGSVGCTGVSEGVNNAPNVDGTHRKLWNLRRWRRIR